MSVCTFLPQLAETPVEQSQDKANEYGLDRLQYGWLEGREGGGEERDKKEISRQINQNQHGGWSSYSEEGGGGVGRETEIKTEGGIKGRQVCI